MSPKPIVLCGPSGVGKSTLLKKLLGDYEKCFGFSVSHTTRKPRPGEEEGVHYHFVSQDKMKEAIEKGEFIEHAQYSGNLYGTNEKAVQEVMDSNRICILDIEMEGVKQVKNTDLNPHFIFVKPPSIESLEERLRARGTETEESLSRRLTVATKEMAFGEEEGNFDLIVTNDDVDRAYEELKQFLIKDIEEVLHNS
ncbi:UNVERIFIED_CONTAM: hypothetical protein GTU68_013990 [Idotea baltica]|nr:hypothetical protein [Idotea baltica]